MKPLRMALLLFAFCGLLAMAGLHAHGQTGKSPQAAASTAQRERGRYLVENVMICFACHSEANWKASGLPFAGKKGAGTCFPDETVPFRIVAPNITPDPATGTGKWTDEQFARAVRDGIGHDGRRLFPVMPYMHYRKLSDADLAAVIAYLRSLPAVRSTLRATPVPPQFQVMVPPPMPPVKNVAPPDLTNPVKRGEYLVTMADCATCHTPVNQKGEPMMNLAFAGGRLLKGPWGAANSANITPDASGIPHYDEKMFIQMMRTGRVGGVRKLNPIMLTGYFRGMSDADLKAIFAYLKTLKPVAHRVDNTEKPAYCKLCGGTHGLGEKN